MQILEALLVAEAIQSLASDVSHFYPIDTFQAKIKENDSTKQIVKTKVTKKNKKSEIDKYPPMAPRRIASDCLETERVSSGKGTPVASNAAPPKSFS